MVTITMENTGWPDMGRMKTYSITTPMSAAARMVTGTSTQNGRASEVARLQLV